MCATNSSRCSQWASQSRAAAPEAQGRAQAPQPKPKTAWTGNSVARTARSHKQERKVEGLSRILKRVFKCSQVRYRRLNNNHARLLGAFAPVNLYQRRGRLGPRAAQGSEDGTGLR